MDLSSLAPIRKMDIGLLREALNTDNITTDEKTQSKETQLLPEIFRLLASLEDDTQKMLLDSWAKLEMPLNEHTVNNLLQYLDNNPALNTEDKLAVIKAFAFLENNGLPFSEKLIDSLRSIFNSSSNLSSTLEQFINSDNFLNQEQLNNLLAQLNLSELKNSLIKINNFNQQPQEVLNQQTTAAQNQESQSSQTSEMNFNTINSESTQNNQSNITPEILESFNNLDQEIKNIILNNLNSLSQNFDKTTLRVLNHFLTNNNIEENSAKMALLKAFSFLENNQLPLIESLIKEMSANFQRHNSEDFANNLINKSDILSNLNNSESNLVSKNEAAVNLNSSATQISENLADYNKISDQLLSLFNKSGGENPEKIADNLLGHKLINLQQQEQNLPLMLALEIPVKLKDNKLSSLLLKVEKEKHTAAKNINDQGYNITFILEFENIGPIQSQINVKQNMINTTFFTENAQTAKLIENHFNQLQSSLKNKGFNINSLKIKNFNNPEEEKEKFFNKLILNELNEESGEGIYRHIDIKI